MMGMALFAPVAKGDHGNVLFPRQGHHLPHQAGQIVPLFDQGAPCGPHGGLGLGQHGPAASGDFRRRGCGRRFVHVVGAGGALE